MADEEWEATRRVRFNQSISISSGKKLKFKYKPLTVPITNPYQLPIEIELLPGNTAAGLASEVTLAASDGTYKKSQQVSTGKEVQPGLRTLVFNGVRSGRRYTCTVQPPDGAPAYFIFKDRVLQTSGGAQA